MNKSTLPPKRHMHRTSTGTQLFLAASGAGTRRIRWWCPQRTLHLVETDDVAHAVARNQARGFDTLLGAWCIMAVSFALAWFPILNTFTGGLVAGFRLKAPRTALRTAVPCALAIAGLETAMLLQLLEFDPSMRRYTGCGAALIALSSLATLAGALAGTRLQRASRAPGRRPPTRERRPACRHRLRPPDSSSGVHSPRQPARRFFTVPVLGSTNSDGP